VNIERTSKYVVAVHHKDFVAMLKRWKPGEFVFNMIPEEFKSVSYELLPQGFQLTFEKKSQGPAELDFNRLQRRVDGDGE
jgi:hypothetical protein